MGRMRNRQYKQRGRPPRRVPSKKDFNINIKTLGEKIMPCPHFNPGSSCYCNLVPDNLYEQYAATIKKNPFLSGAPLKRCSSDSGWERCAQKAGGMASQYNATGKMPGVPSGCYVATCVYGSYDCPEVWTLRRYRDGELSKSWTGRLLIKTYYAVSPKIVKLFGDKKWFNRLFKPVINIIVRALQGRGIDSSPYSDMN